MENPISIQEALQLLLRIRHDYNQFAEMFNTDAIIEAFANIEGNTIPPEFHERMFWYMSRFVQFCYQFPIQSELDKEQNPFKENPNADC